MPTMAVAIQAAGGIAFIEKGDTDRYSLCARELPQFLTSWDQEARAVNAFGQMIGDEFT